MPPRHICCFHTLPPSPSLYLILSHTFIKKRKKNSLSCIFIYLTSSFTSLSFSPLKLPDLFIFSINYLTFLSTSLSLSPLELLTSSSLQLIAPSISYLNFVVWFFLVFLYFLWFYYCLSLKSTFFLLWFLCLFFVVVFT